MSSGLAQMLGAGTLVASNKPFRSRIRPRLGGKVKVRAKRTSPWRLKKALSMTCTYAARTAKPAKATAMVATINLLRQTGVLLVSKGLELS